MRPTARELPVPLATEVPPHSLVEGISRQSPEYPLVTCPSGASRRDVTGRVLVRKAILQLQQERGHGRHFLVRGISRDDAGKLVRAHSGMFPCFFGGCEARFERSERSARVTMTRVAAGSMIESSSPRSAARNGDATL